MLTQELVVVADMSAPNIFQRSSWKAEAIRRGDLKISGPIPITSDVPLNDKEEKIFAKRAAMNAYSQQREGHSAPPKTPLLQPSKSISGTEAQCSALRSNPVEPVPEDYSRLRPLTSPLPAPRVEQLWPGSDSQHVSYTPPATARGLDSAALAAQKKKRKSGFRGVFRKMFGRKSREEDEMPEVSMLRTGHHHHNSDPGLLRTPPPTREVTSSPGIQIAGKPAQEPEPPHRLGAHPPFPMNVHGPGTSLPQEYITFVHQKLRRATLPNLPLDDNRRRSMDETLGRLAIWNEKEDEQSVNSRGIGLALSSPAQALSPRTNRRSRSVGALRVLASTERRRSDEIRYWRTSFGVGSLYSRPETAKTIETVKNVHSAAPLIQESKSAYVEEKSATLVREDQLCTPGQGDELDAELEMHAPVPAFNFGNLKSTYSNEHIVPKAEPVSEAVVDAELEHENEHEHEHKDNIEVDELPIPATRKSHALTEDHARSLDTKYNSLKHTMHRLSTRSNRHTVILENAPKTLRSRDRSTSTCASASPSRSRPSIDEESVRQSTTDTGDDGEPSPALTHLRVASEDASHLALKAMYEALKYERLARKTLEGQLRTLQNDVSDLHALINKFIGSIAAASPSYATPSPDALTSAAKEHLITPRAMTSESYHRNHLELTRASAISKFSHSETGSESGGEELVSEEHSTKGSYEDLTTPEDWTTPKEETFHANAFFVKRSRDNLNGFI